VAADAIATCVAPSLKTHLQLIVVPRQGSSVDGAVRPDEPTHGSGYRTRAAPQETCAQAQDEVAPDTGRCRVDHWGIRMSLFTYIAGITASPRDGTLRFYDANGASTSYTVDFQNYLLPNVTLAVGTLLLDSVIGTLSSDLFIWDDQTEITSYDPYGPLFRYGLVGGLIPYFNMNGGDDLVSLVRATGGIAYTGDVVILGDDGNDILWSGDGDDSIWGGADQDTVYGGGGDDWIEGGTGHDTIHGSLGNDAIWGDDSGGLGDGIDTLWGDVGDDTLYGGGGNDYLDVGDGTDLAYGGDGDDWVTAGAGNNLLYGGAGNDYLVVDTSAAGIDVVYGGTGADIVSTFVGNDTVFGGDDDDALWGGAGSDTVDAGDGADFVYGGEGNGDTLRGGIGEDWFYVSRDDGTGDVIVDDGGEGRVDHLVVFGSFYSGSGTLAGDYFVAGTGINDNPTGPGYELGGSATGDIDIAYALGADPGSATLTIVSTGATVTFDPHEMRDITLWNSDAAPGDPIEEVYSWNAAARGGQGAYVWAG